MTIALFEFPPLFWAIFAALAFIYAVRTYDFLYEFKGFKQQLIMSIIMFLIVFIGKTYI
jgi:hypothetical protein